MSPIESRHIGRYQPHLLPHTLPRVGIAVPQGVLFDRCNVRYPVAVEREYCW
jgi:hypothetical protein